MSLYCVLPLTVSITQEYPWPPGKAPWLVENNGTGQVPQSQPEQSERKREAKPPAAASERKKMKLSKADWRQFEPSQVRPPSSREEAVQMIMLAERMMELGLETRGASSTDITCLKIATSLVLESLL